MNLKMDRKTLRRSGDDTTTLIRDGADLTISLKKKPPVPAGHRLADVDRYTREDTF